MRIEARMECDGGGCDETLRAEPEHRATYAKQTVWNVKTLAENAGWLTVNRGRYHTETHYCPKCADAGTAPPIPRKNPPALVMPEKWKR